MNSDKLTGLAESKSLKYESASTIEIRQTERAKMTISHSRAQIIDQAESIFNIRSFISSDSCVSGKRVSYVFR